MNIFEGSDQELIRRRKEGQGLVQLFDYQCYIDPYLDELINLAHVVGICAKAKMPFYRKFAVKIVNQYYNRNYHGDKGSYLFFLNGFFRVKQIKLNPVSSKNTKVRGDYCETD